LELANLELQREQFELCATSDGTVTSMDIKVGHLVEPGQVLAHLAQQRGFRIDVAVASDQVGHLRLGLPARVKLDAFDYQKYGTVAGKVVFISPDSVSHGESAQPSYTAKIELDSDRVVRGTETGQLKLGMTGTAEIVTGSERILALLVRSIRQSISLG